MIDVLISNNCTYCGAQLDNMKKSFFEEEYRIINIGSDEFKNYDQRERVDGVPYVVIRDEEGKVKYARAGIHNGTELRKIERRLPVESFNLQRTKNSR